MKEQFRSSTLRLRGRMVRFYLAVGSPPGSNKGLWVTQRGGIHGLNYRWVRHHHDAVTLGVYYHRRSSAR